MDLAQPTELRALLERHGVTVDKRLGQHFLVSRRVVDAILDALPEVRGVLEVGPGPGILTRALVASGRAVTAVELDRTMAPVLSESAPDARLVIADALRQDLGAILADLPSPRAVVSNMPYNITGPLLARFAELREHVSCMVLMMQREVGDRVLAPAGDRHRGALTIDLQSRFAIGKVADVPAGAFWPPPKVDSVVLGLKPNDRVLEDPDGLRRFVHGGFRQPRKTLVNNLLAMGHERERIVASLRLMEVRDDARPAALDVDAWIALRGKLG
ncbi:MAG: ribosomal RNA small subunit methyltransferase A [Fimbriimonadaceae bacterium]|nr:ribosomal RNA small subunit methyltransferase A [Fimbriimonadaceae bacterium]